MGLSVVWTLLILAVEVIDKLNMKLITFNCRDYNNDKSVYVFQLRATCFVLARTLVV